MTKIQPRRITEIENEWSERFSSDEEKDPGAAGTAQMLITEAAPHRLRTQVQEARYVVVGDGRCLIDCTLAVLETSEDDETKEPKMTSSTRWVHPSLAALYEPTAVINGMLEHMKQLDREAEWAKLEILCNALIDVLKQPLTEKAGDIDLKTAIRKIDWGRLPVALPETYRKAYSAAQQAGGLQSIAHTAQARDA